MLLRGENVINGIGFFEVMVIVLIVLMFFGSKELPHFIRESARLIAKLRQYSDKVRRELDEITSIMDSTTVHDPIDDVNTRKEKIRKEKLTLRAALTPHERNEKSVQILNRLSETDEYRKARVILFYASSENEVQTDAGIRAALAAGKRVVLPYCKQESTIMGIAEITDPDKELSVGTFGIREPVGQLRNKFLKSDIEMVVCPGVAYDTDGARLGRGKGYYDHFLAEMKSKIPIAGLGFKCQITNEIPFDYHDIKMDIIITEDGITRHT
jgi:5-formyltetrahydrofolate cyclo-ligase